MINFKKQIARRTVLRGAGATLALPMLDAMTPAFANARERAAAPIERRLQMGADVIELVDDAHRARFRRADQRPGRECGGEQVESVAARRELTVDAAHEVHHVAIALHLAPRIHAHRAGARHAAEASLANAERKTADYEAKLREAKAAVYKEQEDTRKTWLSDQSAQVGRAKADAQTRVAAAKTAITTETGAARTELEQTTQALAEQIATSLVTRRAQ